MKREPVWLFDLDNTLHNASHAIFPSINRRMTAYIQRHLALDEPAAQALRERYWRRYGATLTGLVLHHGTDPDHFLSETHQLGDIAPLLRFDAPIRRVLRRLPGRKVIFSNGPRQYALQVVAAMGLSDSIDALFAIEDMRYQPKPGMPAFRRLLAALRVRPERCILVEDSAANLLPAKRLGMRTVWISSSVRCPPHVDLRLGRATALGRASLRALGPLAAS
ncbi:MAG: pyrimidine 5'-nucleotidase [Rhodocyclaceae bacterium]|nr:pyrimidine 5'-nucleotidase [Rhodocyclaceae bacterium]